MTGPEAPVLELPDTGALDAILDEVAEADADITEADNQGRDVLGKTDLEARAELASLARLHYKRRMLMRRLAPLVRLFEGAGATADAKRKQHRHMIGTLIQREQGIKGDKVETMLERLANQDERHLTFCQYLDDLHDRYQLGKITLKELDELIRDRDQSHTTYNRSINSRVWEGEGA